MTSEANHEDTSKKANGTAIEECELSIPSAIWASITDCLDNAERLLIAATKVDEEHIHNVAYHLAGLALEEIGKADMVAADHCASHTTQEPRWIEKQAFDHVGKLFWALWGPSFGRELITAEQLASFEGLAKHIHSTRLQGLYVNLSEGQDVLPKDAVTEAEARNLLGLASTRLEMARLWKPYVLTDEERTDLRWFNEATANPEKRRMIMGQKSMTKLVELGDAAPWIHWLRVEFERAEAEARAQTDQELRRAEPAEQEELEPKWQLRIRLHTNSHSVRAKTLNSWNSISNWIKLASVDGKKQQLIVDFTLPKAVLANSLWWAGWGAARRFVAALNIASMGFFWWYVPEQISRYYEKLTDVETNSGFVVERSPMLRLDWHRDALSDQELRDTALCFAMLPGLGDKDKHEPFDHYLTGLGFLSKTDVHTQFEANSYQSFYLALKTGMRTYNDWNEEAPYSSAFEALTSDFLRDRAVRSKIVRIGESFSTAQPALAEITLSDVGTLKILCDFYFLLTFRRLMQQRRQAQS